ARSAASRFGRLLTVTWKVICTVSPALMVPRSAQRWPPLMPEGEQPANVAAAVAATGLGERALLAATPSTAATIPLTSGAEESLAEWLKAAPRFDSSSVLLPARSDGMTSSSRSRSD